MVYKNKKIRKRDWYLNGKIWYIIGYNKYNAIALNSKMKKDYIITIMEKKVVVVILMVKILKMNII